MLGHYVDGLSPEAEDRVLTRKLTAAPAWRNPDGECLVCAAVDVYGKRDDREFQRHFYHDINGKIISVGWQYDKLHNRFGERLNIAIRNRILANRARRLLAAPTVTPILQEVTV